MTVRGKRYFPLRGWIVYMLETSTGNYYTGVTTDVGNRVKTHNLGKGAKCLRGQLPVKLVWQSPRSMSRSEALVQEAEMKTKSHLEKKALIEAQI